MVLQPAGRRRFMRLIQAGKALVNGEEARPGAPPCPGAYAASCPRRPDGRLSFRPTVSQDGRRCLHAGQTRSAALAPATSVTWTCRSARRTLVRNTPEIASARRIERKSADLNAGLHKSQILVLVIGSSQQRPPGFSSLESQMPAAQAAQAARGRPPCVAQYSRRASQFSHLGIAGMTPPEAEATGHPLR